MPTKRKTARRTRRKESARTDAISILKGDHERVRQLLRRLENTDLLSEIENEVKVGILTTACEIHIRDLDLYVPTDCARENRQRQRGMTLSSEVQRQLFYSSTP
jgi:hypothetical protein